MPASDRDFVGSIPELYDTLLVPLIFEPYAADLAERVVTYNPNEVLETAAGSGVVARALAPKLQGDARYLATDLNQPMLDRAQERMRTDTVTWECADAMALPYKDNSFDVAICQFGAMFFPDRIKSYQEVHRVLREKGIWIFNVWADISLNEFANAVTDAAAEVFPEDPPTFLPRVAHGYNDLEQINAELTDAGFRKISTETITHKSSASSAHIPAIAYCQGTPLRNEIEARNPDQLEAATAVATDLIIERFGNTEISGSMCAHVITALRD